MEKAKFFPHPTLWNTVWPGWEAVCIYSFGEVQRNSESKVERGEGGSFSDGYFTVRPPDIGCKNIFDRITSRLYLCNKGSYNELIQEFYGTAASY